VVKVHDLAMVHCGLNWCNSSTDSTVWMGEDGVSLNCNFKGSIFMCPFEDDKNRVFLDLEKPISETVNREDSLTCNKTKQKD
jgi:hypothetical protein